MTFAIRAGLGRLDKVRIGSVLFVLLLAVSALARPLADPVLASAEAEKAYRAALSREHPAPGLIPHGRVAEGMGLRAWFADATDRYPHGVLGDRLEAATLAVERDGKIFRHTIDHAAVFEDLEPRITDLDRDGQPEVLVIRADPFGGAQPVLFGLRGERLVELAQGAPIGTGSRWLNPAGVGDFDGDGVLEVAVIRTPHIGGILIHYQWDGGARLVAERAVRGYSTHRIGSTVLDLSAVIDWDGDGLDDLILPPQHRQSLTVVGVDGDRFVEKAVFAGHGMEIAGPLRVMNDPETGQPVILYRTEDDRVWMVPARASR